MQWFGCRVVQFSTEFINPGRKRAKKGKKEIKLKKDICELRKQDARTTVLSDIQVAQIKFSKLNNKSIYC